MARFDGGWIKLHRKLFGSEWSALLDATAQMLFVHLLSMANYKETRYTQGDTVHILNRGQVLTSVLELSNRIQMGRKATQKRLTIMENTGTISQKRNSVGSIITILNYNRYQEMENNEGTSSDTTKEHRVIQRGNTEGHNDGTLNEEVKNLKNSKKVKKEKKVNSIPSLALGSAWLNLGQSWLDFALTVYPWQSTQLKWKPEIFGRELERVGIIMSVDVRGMAEILERVKVDDFWGKNVASPFGLTSRGKNGNRKIDNLIVSLKTKRDKTIESIEKWANQPELENDGRPTMLF